MPPPHASTTSSRAGSIPKSRIILMGFCDAVSSALGIISATHLSGPQVVILGQGVVPLTMLASCCVGRVPQSRWQWLCGAGIVLGLCVSMRLSAMDGVQVLNAQLAVLALVPSAISLGSKQQVIPWSSGAKGVFGAEGTAMSRAAADACGMGCC